MSARSLVEIEYEVIPGRYPYRLVKDLIVDLDMGLTGSHCFYQNDVRRGTLSGDQLTILAGYASDGASPYIATVMGIRLGTPSSYAMAPGFFTHDFLYQFKPVKCSQWSYEQADDTLYSLMRQQGSPFAGIYHMAVATLGGIYRRMKVPQSNVSCSYHGSRTLQTRWKR